MKALNIVGTFIILLLCVASCSKESVEHFLRRDTDKLSFGYKSSKQTFTLRSSQAWTIDLNGNDWISVDTLQGGATGERVLNVGVTVSRNLGAQREGIITLKSGDKTAEITVTQQEGTVIFGTPYFTQPLLPGTPLEEAYIVIPYSKGGLEGLVTVQSQISGPGAAGIQVPNTEVDMSNDVGEVRIPVSGTPTQEGMVNIGITLLGQTVSVNSEVKPQGNTDPVGTVYLSQDFNLLVLGGDHFNKAAGLQLQGDWATLDGKRVLPENPVFAISGTGNTDGSNDYFATMHPSYVAMRGLAGWTGSRVYERPGLVKINTASSTDGYLATPKLSAIQGWADIKVKFKAARWSENATNDKDATVAVFVRNAGTSALHGVHFELTPNLTEFEVIVEGATSETVIEFRGRNAANSRFFLDDIHISKVIK